MDISEEGIRIDLKRIDGIFQINLLRNINELQSFIGKINFLRRFIPNLAELLRIMTNMLKRDIIQDQGSKYQHKTSVPENGLKMAKYENVQLAKFKLKSN